MNIHKFARLMPRSRVVLVRRVVTEGQSLTAVAAGFGITVKNIGKWVARFEAEGSEGIADRSSLPHRLYRPPPAAIVEQAEALRRQRWTGKQITADLRHRNFPILHQPHCLKFELAAEIASQHSHSPVPSNALSRCSVFANRQ